MTDLSDPLEGILAMADETRHESAQAVRGSRYMKGGKQIGRCPVKRTLSWLAGLSLHWLAGLGIREATNNFRSFSAEFLRHVAVESRQGFDMGLELRVKAYLDGIKFSEVPSVWQELAVGKSRFQLLSWLPRCPGRYAIAMKNPLLC